MGLDAFVLYVVLSVFFPAAFRGIVAAALLTLAWGLKG